jgi:hypothetical protein
MLVLLYEWMVETNIQINTWTDVALRPILHAFALTPLPIYTTFHLRSLIVSLIFFA